MHSWSRDLVVRVGNGRDVEHDVAVLVALVELVSREVFADELDPDGVAVVESRQRGIENDEEHFGNGTVPKCEPKCLEPKSLRIR